MTNTFDANGNVLTVKEGAATITRQYDALNRVTNYINAAGASIRYTYDAASNLTSLRYPDGKTVTYAYDAHNRLSSVTDWASRVTSFTYDLNGRLTRMDRPNGTRRELSYDGAGQVREIAEKKANGRLIALFRLDYDAGGRPSYEFTVPKPQTWALPELDATADADNRLATVNGQSVTHDADGNMTAGFLAQGTNAAMMCYRLFSHRRFRLFHIVGIWGGWPGWRRILRPNCRALVVGVGCGGLDWGAGEVFGRAAVARGIERLGVTDFFPIVDRAFFTS